MKRFLFFAFALVLSAFTCVFAQQSGSIHYEYTLPALSGADLQAKIKKVRETVPMQMLQDEIIRKISQAPDPMRYVLHFNGTESVYARVSTDDMPEGITIKHGSVYKNTQTQALVENDFIFEKEFLMQEELPAIAWELTDSTRNIMPFKAKMAKATVDGVAVEVWFTTDIPAKTGPANLSGLNGLILEVYYANGRAIRFKGFSAAMLVGAKVEAPTKGTKIGRKDFEETRKKRYQEASEASRREGPFGG